MIDYQVFKEEGPTRSRASKNSREHFEEDIELTDFSAEGGASKKLRSKKPANGFLGAEPVQIELDGRRWIFLVVYCVFSFANQFQFVMFSAIVSETKTFFGISSLQVNVIGLSYTFIYPVVAPFVCILLHRLGLKGVLVLGNVLNTTGAGIRLAALWTGSAGYALLLAGHCVCAVAQLAVSSIPPIVANEWFSAKERTVATALAFMANNLGLAVGLLAAPRIVLDASTPFDGFLVLFIVGVALSAVPMLAMLCMPAKPRSPPNYAAMVTPNSVNLWASTKDLLRKSRSFVMNLLSSSLTIGTIWSISTVAPQMLGPFGAPEKDSSAAAFSALVGGTVVGIIVGLIIDRKREYKIPMLALIFLTCISLSISIATLYAGLPIVGLFFYSLGGVFQNSVVPVFFEYGQEVSFPAPESIGSTSMMFGSSIFAFATILGMSELLGENPSRNEAVMAFVLFVLFQLLSGVLCFLKGDDLKRLEYERRMIAAEVLTSFGADNVFDMEANETKAKK
jgi:MFS family permease